MTEFWMMWRENEDDVVHVESIQDMIESRLVKQNKYTLSKKIYGFTGIRERF